MNQPNWELDFLDFPTAWWIQEQGLTHTDPRCSAVQSNGAFLCDCGAVNAEWTRRRSDLTSAAAPDPIPVSAALLAPVDNVHSQEAS